jgi:hypothetical protein
MFVHHQVSDFARWKKTYDAVETMRQTAGVTADAVLQAHGNPNDVTVFHDFASLDAAKAFAGSSDLKAAMMEAGVTSKPEIWFASSS